MDNDNPVNLFSRKTNVMGNEYDIYIGTSDEYGRLIKSDGYCDYDNKAIYIERHMYPDMCELNISESDFARQSRHKYVLRHELVHAFIAECGLNGSEIDNENIVSWIAYKFPQMLDAFRKADAL